MAGVADKSASKTPPQSRFKRSPRSMEEGAKQSILSPSLRSAAAIAGWDEETLLFATLVVEDTPVRESQHMKRHNQNLKSPLTSSSSSIRKRRCRRQLADPIPAVVLYRDDDEDVSSRQVEIMEKESGSLAPHEEKKCDLGEEVSAEKACVKVLPCMDRLREELSCAICLDICYEPSTIPCGHSFCKKCLKRATNKCGKKCPKCRQLISNNRLSIVNIVLWNTIQLLFPEEVEARKKVGTLDTFLRKDIISSDGSKLERILSNTRSRHFRNRDRSSSSSSFGNETEILEIIDGDRCARRRYNRSIGSQFGDIALALRLQREEFLEAFKNSRG